ncbi:APC family permease [Leucobacter sp. cx-42]|uniref:APC family permease n=1 Tax=unclassified Leucobacter TaxID=2621730 RepID=UPI00165EB55C|nr:MULTISPECIES: APC family permease [unclassified Leucobacter]MBC9953799.1 APC family permease [Leucobacter sp. cx-42]
MSSSQTAPAVTNGEPKVGLRRTLGLPTLILFGISYMSPVAVFTTYGLINQQTGGLLPATYLVATLAMLLTAYSYGRMVASVPTAGSAYRYARQSFGPHIGFMTGWTLMLDYLFLPMVSFLLAGVYLNSIIPSVPQWAFSVGLLLVVFALNVLGVKLVSRVSAIIMGLTAIIIGIFVVLGFAKSEVEPGQMFASFSPSGDQLPLVIAGAAILAFSFLGFDGISTMAEETKNPRRTVPRATILATLIAGVLFALVAWAGNLAHPSLNYDNVDAAGVEIMVQLGGQIFGVIFVIVYVMGCFASAMVSQASVSRILLTMGRDGVLPRGLAYVHPRFQTPVIALALVAFVALLSTVLTIEQAVVMINFGALVAFSMVNLSVIKHYLIDRKEVSVGSIFRHGLIPALGFVVTAFLWTQLSGPAFIVGFVWLGAGLVYLAISTRFFTKKPVEVDFSE